MPEITVTIPEKHAQLFEKIAVELSGDKNAAFSYMIEELARSMELTPVYEAISDHERRIAKLEGKPSVPQQRERKTISGKTIRW
jgi:hypothetical protein